MTGSLTTHILDTAKGKPAKGVKITLYQMTNNKRVRIKSIKTNEDGRTNKPIMPKGTIQKGTYELHFHVGEYNKNKKFLDVVPVRFNVDGKSHYHVPLLVSKFGYSTYRGS